MVNRESTVVHNDTPVMKVLEILRAGNIQRAAVVDQNGLFLGIITDYELLPLFTKHASDVWDYLTAMMDRTKVRPMLDGQLSSVTAQEVMKKEASVVTEETLFEEAVKMMIDKGLKRIPVVDKAGVYKGMISRDTVLRMIL